MKKSLLAISVGAMLSASAYADPTVTLWGSLDAGILSSSSPGGLSAASPIFGTQPNAHNTGFVEGVISPSEWGIKASEDLGGGLKAGASLTGGLNIANGQIDNPGGGGLFGREANLYIGGADWGTIRAGLQYDPAVLASISTGPRGFTDSASNASYWIIATAGNGSKAFTFPGGIFDQNAVSYTYSGNGLFLGVIHAFGGVAGSSSANSGSSIGATYTNSGFTVSGSYATYNCAGGNAFDGQFGKCTPGQTTSKIDGAGLAWTDGSVWTVRGQYMEFKFNYDATGTAANDIKSAGVGADWAQGNNTVNLAFYDVKDAGAAFGGKTTEVALTDYYKLSKSTKLWAEFITANAGTNAGASSEISGIYANALAYSNAFAGGYAGGKTNIIGVGMIKSF
jgi:predicted porin